jgi:hypothetical protein
MPLVPLNNLPDNFGGVIHDRDPSNYGQTESGKLTHFIPSVVVSLYYLRDYKDATVIQLITATT